MNSIATQEEVLSAIAALQQLADVFNRRREQIAREVGLTVQQYCVMEQVQGDRFMPSMFARERESSAAAVSKIIRQLIDKGLIEVAVSESDGRNRLYSLTHRGSVMMEKIRASRQAAIAQVWSEFDTEEVEAFAAFSKRLHDRLESFAKQKEK